MMSFIIYFALILVKIEAVNIHNEELKLARSPSSIISHEEVTNSAAEMRDLSTDTEVSIVIPPNAVTYGAWAFAKHDGSSCDTITQQPSVTGFILGKCQGNIGGFMTSHKYTSCAMSSDRTEMIVHWDYFIDSAHCDGPSSPKITTYSGLQNGCKGGTVYTCGTEVKVSDYGSPQHVGNWNNKLCNDDEGEMEWNIESYESCTVSGECTAASDSYSFKAICDNPRGGYCFHVDSTIDYKGVLYSFEDLQAGKEPECNVPHTPSSRGVVISTSCNRTARVTDTHLMATTKGFRLAYSLKAGDVMFGDYDQAPCTVTSVHKEEDTQQYFGLNCVHSEVLVSGLRASTFGNFHTLPSWYMTYVGGLMGPATASAIGGYIAEWCSLV